MVITIKSDSIHPKHQNCHREENDNAAVIKLANLTILCEKVKNDMLSNLCQPKQNIHATLQKLCDVLIVVKNQVSLIERFASHYDSRVGVKANGYRSFITINCTVVNKLTGFLVKLQEKSQQNYDKSFETEFEYWVRYFSKLSKINSFLIELQKIAMRYQYQLFPAVHDIKANPALENISEAIALEDVSIFFGQGVGIHVNLEVRRVIQLFLVFQAFISNLPFFSSYPLLKTLGSLVSSFFGLRYLYDSEYLAKKILSNAREQQVTFGKRFYNSSELPIAEHVIKIGAPSISTNVLISIPPKRIIIENKDDNLYEVPIPNSHLGHKNLNVRFLSTFRTTAMIGDCSCYTKFRCSCRKQCPPSRSIIFHAHGGGFVAQTSKSHETYLKCWAQDTDIPIVSVDYSLAPEAPYPRAAEEVFYAYSWMRNNFECLGTTGENIIFAGDSAGANFVLGVALQCIRHNLPGPTSLSLFYPAMIVQTFPSPSRLLSLLDPLGMFPFLLRCMNSYTDVDYVTSCPRTYEDELHACLVPNRDPLVSPLLTPPETLAQLPKTYLFSSTIDTCLDESIEFSNKLMDVGVPV